MTYAVILIKNEGTIGEYTNVYQTESLRGAEMFTENAIKRGDSRVLLVTIIRESRLEGSDETSLYSTSIEK